MVDTIGNILIGLFVLLLMQLAWAEAAQVSFAWKPPTRNNDGSLLTNLAGFRVYFGTASGVYTEFRYVADANQITIPNLTVGQRYYFSVVAVTDGQFEGARSQEISWLAEPTPSPVVESCVATPTGCAITWSAQAGNQYEVQVSSDLRVWTTAPSGILPEAQGVRTALSDGLLTYVDATAGLHSKRYYRLSASSL